METFEQFLKRILVILFWILLALPLFLLPLVFLIIPLLGIDLIDANLVLVAILDPIKGLELANSLGLGPSSLFFKIAAFPGFSFAAVMATLTILWERKLLAKVQVRVGPLYAGRFEGILQPIADLFKLLGKELVVPDKADKPFFWAAPLLMLSFASAVLAVIPLSPSIYITTSEFSVLIPFVILGLSPMLILVAGWASSNKFAFIGALRALHQMIAYEIPMLISVLGVVVLTGSFNFFDVVTAQETIWFIVPQIIGASIFYITILSELERIPFDIPEADSELVAGWLTEYSGMNFGLIQLANYIKLYALSVLFTLLFLGGWNGPSFLPPFGWMILKVSIVITLILLPRAFLPRLRIDQLIRLGWLWLIVLGFINLFIAVLVSGMGII